MASIPVENHSVTETMIYLTINIGRIRFQAHTFWCLLPALMSISGLREVLRRFKSLVSRTTFFEDEAPDVVDTLPVFFTAFVV